MLKVAETSRTTSLKVATFRLVEGELLKGYKFLIEGGYVKILTNQKLPWNYRFSYHKPPRLKRERHRGDLYSKSYPYVMVFEINGQRFVIKDISSLSFYLSSPRNPVIDKEIRSLNDFLKITTDNKLGYLEDLKQYGSGQIGKAGFINGEFKIHRNAYERIGDKVVKPIGLIFNPKLGVNIIIMEYENKIDLGYAILWGLLDTKDEKIRRDITRQCMDILGNLHRVKIVHRDLKSLRQFVGSIIRVGNRTKLGRLKLLDFGAAKDYEGAEDRQLEKRDICEIYDFIHLFNELRELNAVSTFQEEIAAILKYLEARDGFSRESRIINHLPELKEEIRNFIINDGGELDKFFSNTINNIRFREISSVKTAFLKQLWTFSDILDEGVGGDITRSMEYIENWFDLFSRKISFQQFKKMVLENKGIFTTRIVKEVERLTTWTTNRSESESVQEIIKTINKNKKILETIVGLSPRERERIRQDIIKNKILLLISEDKRQRV